MRRTAQSSSAADGRGLCGGERAPPRDRFSTRCAHRHPFGLGKRMGLGRFLGHGCVGGLRGWSRAWGVVRGSHTGNGRKSSGRLTTHICLEAGMIIRHSREVRRDCVREGDGSLLLSTPIPISLLERGGTCATCLRQRHGRSGERLEGSQVQNRVHVAASRLGGPSFSKSPPPPVFYPRHEI